jgi:methyl-accepting chemotaxis protein
MYIFSEKAHASIEDVTAFRNKVIFFEEVCNNELPQIEKAARELYESTTKQANSAKKVAKNYERLYSSVKWLESNVSAKISSLKTQLANTPEMLEQEYVDAEGNKHVKKKPNPEYTELELMIYNENSRLNEIRDLAYKVNNELSYTSEIASRLFTYSYEINDAIPELQRCANDMINKAESANHALSRDIESLENYASFTFSF